MRTDSVTVDTFRSPSLLRFAPGSDGAVHHIDSHAYRRSGARR